MKKSLAALATAAALGLTLSGTVAPAQAAPAAPAAPAASAAAAPAKGCVTRAEYRKAKKGMTKARVHKIFGTTGMLVSKQPNYEARGYEVCGKRPGGVGVVFQKGKLAQKAIQFA